MEQRERADRNWDHLESEDAYLQGNDVPGQEELPPSLQYTPTLPKRQEEENEPMARGQDRARVDRDPLRILAPGLSGNGNGKGTTSRSELARIVGVERNEEKP